MDALRARIADEFGLTIKHETSADAFAGYVTAARVRLGGEGVDVTGLPLFGAHINPDWSYIAPHCFMATLGYWWPKLATTNTARLYEFDAPHSIRWLMESCRLWYDEPELHAPLMTCEVTSDDPRMDQPVSSVIHVGTAWVHPSLRGKGLGRLMVALHRAEAFDRLKAPLMFGTTVASKDGKWTGSSAFNGTAVVRMGAKDDPNVVPEVQQVRIYTPDSILSDAQRIAESGINATTAQAG